MDPGPRSLSRPDLADERLDVHEGLVIDPRRAVVGTAAGVGPFQDLAAVHLS